LRVMDNWIYDMKIVFMINSVLNNVMVGRNRNTKFRTDHRQCRFGRRKLGAERNDELF